jgi:hypothetical protein
VNYCWGYGFGFQGDRKDCPYYARISRTTGSTREWGLQALTSYTTNGGTTLTRTNHYASLHVKQLYDLYSPLRAKEVGNERETVVSVTGMQSRRVL